MKQTSKQSHAWHRFRRPSAPSTETFWLYALLGFAALILLQFASSWYVFARVGNAGAGGSTVGYAPEGGAAADTVDRARLDAALRFFDERAARFEEIKTGDAAHDE